jgi:CRP-like cAMP-binding protein
MLLTIDRVVIMKSVDIFADTPERILASVARIVEEVDLAAGETLFREGDPGDCLYIVVEGELRVSSRDRTLVLLGPGKIVGELALLDPEPRSASVAASRDTLLFRIDKEPFDEVMADRPEIALGIIRSLARRIRQLGRTVAGASEAVDGQAAQ